MLLLKKATWVFVKFNANYKKKLIMIIKFLLYYTIRGFFEIY